MSDNPKRSVSQLNQFVRCPMSYKLGRLDKVWARPAAWLAQGRAFHAVAEEYELSLAAKVRMSTEKAYESYRTHYAAEIEASTDETPNFDFWSWSGPYNGERDIARRHGIGLEQVDKFIQWHISDGQEIWWTPTGTPGIELEFCKIGRASCRERV